MLHIAPRRLALAASLATLLAATPTASFAQTTDPCPKNIMCSTTTQTPKPASTSSSAGSAAPLASSTVLQACLIVLGLA